MTTALSDRIVARYMRGAEQRQADQTALTLGNPNKIVVPVVPPPVFHG
jgi:hypothetical protein